MGGRIELLVVLVGLSGCASGDTHDAAPDTTQGSSGGDEESEEPTAFTATGGPTQGSPQPTSPSGDDATSSATGSSGSSGDLAPAECSDGMVASGELCLGDYLGVPAEAGQADIVAADLNGDGVDDFVTVESEVHLVRAYFGGENIPARIEEAAVAGPTAIALASVNADASRDIAVIFTGFGLGVATWLNDGNGALVDLDAVVVGESPIAFATGDFRGVGTDDAVVVDQEAPTSPLLVASLEGGLMQSGEIVLGSGRVAVDVIAADIDGDALLDVVHLVRAVDPGTDALEVRRGFGDGTFEPPVTVALPAAASSLHSADFDGDGADDIAVAGSQTVIVFDALSPSLERVDVDISSSSHITSADLDLDGAPELVVLQAPLDTVTIRPGANDRTFAVGASVNLGVGRVPGAVAVGDFNGDGATDLAVALVQVADNEMDQVGLFLSDP